MMIEYIAELHLSDPGLAFSEKEKGLLQKAAEDFNLRTMEMANPKTIGIEEITPHSLKIKLLSTLPLKSVGRALRFYTNLLIQRQEFADRMTSTGLFRTTLLGETVKDREVPSPPPEQISDLALLQALQRYLFERKDGGSKAYRQKRAAIEKMKELAKDSGIL